jgi:hypothetical protein
MNELHAAFGKRAALSFLVGDIKPVQALRLARDVSGQFQADFPAFAADLPEGDTRAASWSLAEILKDE